MTKYGIGFIDGEIIDEKFIRKRPKHVKGPLTINGRTFTAASGSGRAYGCPWGTYILTAQPVASTIIRVYRRFEIFPDDEGFGTVWNVGLPGNITGVGYDVPVKRRRGSIQIHADPAMKSIGCIVLNKEQFYELAQEMKGHDDDMAIEVLPAENGANFRIFPRLNTEIA